MKAREKKILWSIAGATLVALLLLYFFCPPVHKWGNSLLGRNEREIPKPDTTNVDEYEYGVPVEEIKTETIDVPRDSLLDSLFLSDSTVAGMVHPVPGPPPSHVPGFGEGPLPPAPSDDDLPTTAEASKESATPAVTPVVIDEIEQHTSSNATLNNKMTACRSNYTKLVDLYNEYVKKPTTEMQEIGAKRKDSLLKELSQLMKAAQKANDDAVMEEVADIRRQVNKMKF